MTTTANLGTKWGAAALVAATLAAIGCDVQLMPEAASYDGVVTPRLEVVVQAAAMPAQDVAAVDLELVEVSLHRESDDAWVWIAGDAENVELSLGGIDAQAVVPLLADHYDRVRIVLDTPRVASHGKWKRAELVVDELELELDLDLDADTRLELRFDVAESLSGNASGWRFEPRAWAHAGHAQLP
jgi:hypothetical protein